MLRLDDNRVSCFSAFLSGSDSTPILVESLPVGFVPITSEWVVLRLGYDAHCFPAKDALSICWGIVRNRLAYDSISNTYYSCRAKDRKNAQGEIQHRDQSFSARKADMGDIAHDLFMILTGYSPFTKGNPDKNRAPKFATDKPVSLDHALCTLTRAYREGTCFEGDPEDKTPGQNSFTTSPRSWGDAFEAGQEVGESTVQTEAELRESLRNLMGKCANDTDRDILRNLALGNNVATIAKTLGLFPMQVHRRIAELRRPDRVQTRATFVPRTKPVPLGDYSHDCPDRRRITPPNDPTAAQVRREFHYDPMSGWRPRTADEIAVLN